MLRLIKDGKIVGYETHEQGEIFHKHKIPTRGTTIIAVTNGDEWYIPHDSFDLGIKVGDEWWFANDLVEFDTECLGEDCATTVKVIGKGRIEFDGVYFYVDQTNIEETFGGSVFEDMVGDLFSWEELKRIGNIYEQAGD